MPSESASAIMIAWERTLSKAAMRHPIAVAVSLLQSRCCSLAVAVSLLQSRCRLLRRQRKVLVEHREERRLGPIPIGSAQKRGEVGDVVVPTLVGVGELRVVSRLCRGDDVDRDENVLLEVDVEECCEHGERPRCCFKIGGGGA